jgi:transketolase
MTIEAKAAELRRTIFEAGLKGGGGHIPGCFSWVEIAVALFYGGVLRFDAKNPDWPDRDRFILSKGHACLTLYAVLADLGYFPREELDRFQQDGAMLQGHPDHATPGIEVSTGSLGHGLGIGAGMALDAKLKGASWRTFVLLGDGECQEGSVWEAASFAAKHKLSNLVVIVDSNRLGATERCAEDLAGQFCAFGWWVRRADGHNISRLQIHLVPVINQPLCVIADTVKGRGVPFMEDSTAWHHQMPKGAQIDEARKALA